MIATWFEVNVARESRSDSQALGAVAAAVLSDDEEISKDVSDTVSRVLMLCNSLKQSA